MRTLARTARTLPALLAATTLIAPGTAFASWPTDPAVNLPVCTASGAQQDPSVVSDGRGGTIICWTDSRSGFMSTIYAQRLDACGSALWTPGGVPLAAPVDSVFATVPSLVADGAGGAIAMWGAARYYSALSTIDAQRIDASGTLLWNGGAAPVVVLTGAPYLIGLVGDDAGGAVCGWADAGNPSLYRQYVQRVDAGGHLSWPAGGVPMTTIGSGANGQFAPDGSGGVISAWTDTHSGNWDVYAQRVDGTGTLRWGVNGLAVCPQPQIKWMPGVVSDGAGGAVVSWTDLRVSGSPTLYGQRFDSSGAAQWPTGGSPITSSPAYLLQGSDTLVADGHGGVFAIWNAPAGLTAQHLDGTGTLQWAASGVALDSTGSGHTLPVLATDGSGGLLAAWPAGSGARAQSVSAAGVRQWGGSVPLSTAPGTKEHLGLVTDGHGGLTAVWGDGRGSVDPRFPVDIYAQHLGFDGLPDDLAVAMAGAHALALAAPWPSPARAGEAIALRWTQPSSGRVRLTIADVAGRRVRTLTGDVRGAGTNRANWDGRDDAGHAVAPGLYFVRLETADRGAAAKLVIAP